MTSSLEAAFRDNVMSLTSVTSDDILSAMQHVPASRWSEALDAIKALQEPASPSTNPSRPIRTGMDLRGSELIGIWADRSDITDSGEIARELRYQAEQRTQ